MDKTIEETRLDVREQYAEIAARGVSCCGPAEAEGGGCCGVSPAAEIDAKRLAEAVGYDADELAGSPEAANLGLSCGNPIAIAALRPGQVVVDLGSGAGFDAFLAGPKVGESGRVIGVDMTPAMLDRARANLASYRESTGLDNVEFRLGEIEHLPLADASVDVVISNCVINLSADKPAVWAEIARVLKPGGVVAASDMALFRELPEAVKGKLENWIGCVSGAVLLDAYVGMMEASGLGGVKVVPKPAYVEALCASDDPLYRAIKADLPEGEEPGDYITSVDVEAVKGDKGGGEGVSLSLACSGPDCC
ncbi:MAG: arsenite methyltransferase [Planctomycetota bacterium]